MKRHIIKTLQNVREVHYQPNRSALPKPDVLYLMRLRGGQLPTELPLARFDIPVTVKEPQESHAQAVKITHR